VGSDNQAAAARIILGEDDTLVLHTVGIDIGSATSQIVFSDLTLERRGNRYETVERTVTYASDILLTPFISDETVDSDSLAAFFDEQYAKAGVSPDDVDTGAVILTGVALLRHNAEAVANLFAGYSGRFVSVAAGDEIEAMLAAYGSGAVEASHGSGTINADIGGGTTKLSLCVDGRVEQSAAVDVGARLIAWNDQDAVVRLEPAGRVLARLAGVQVAIGETLTDEHKASIAQCAVDVLADAAAGHWQTQELGELARTAPLPPTDVSTVLLSGGMARYVEGSEDRVFGDLGPWIARLLPAALEARNLVLKLGSATIRATVVGASQFTVQVSGTTIHVSGRRALPLRNIPVGVVADGGTRLADRVALTVRQTPPSPEALVLALHWEGTATFAALDGYCGQVLEGVRVAGRPHDCLVLVIDHDIAGLIGAHLVEELGYEGRLVVIDGVELDRFDFVDVGDYLPHSASLPVTIKSLAF
jgi:ethanolamine utilization protein EutA